MKHTTAITAMLSLGSLVVLGLSSCNNKESSTGAEPPEETGALEKILLSEPPAGAVNISEARKDPTPGREITVSGEVIGSHDPLIEGRALVVIGDPTRLTPCNRMPGDSCETPWDVCCDDPDVVKDSIATVQVLDEEGRPLKEGLRGLDGLAELSFLTVTGTVAEGSSADNLLINATGIHVAEESPFKDAPPVQPAEEHDHAGHEDEHQS